MAEAVVSQEKYLTCRLDDELYAFEISKVREVLELPGITKVPRTPDFMRGVINLRGSVVPVVDLRRKFDMPETESTVDTCIVIVEVQLGDTVTVLGALTDSVQEVIELSPDQIEPPPRMGSRLDTDFIKGMGKLGEEFVIILDIDHVLSSEEVELVHEAGQSSQSEPEPDAKKKRSEDTHAPNVEAECSL